MERKLKITVQGKAVDALEVPILESTERWSELRLEDGAVIRVKPMVLGVIRIEGQWDREGNPMYAIKGGQNVVTIVSVPDNLKKPADADPTGKAN